MTSLYMLIRGLQRFKNALPIAGNARSRLDLWYPKFECLVSQGCASQVVIKYPYRFVSLFTFLKTMSPTYKKEKESLEEKEGTLDERIDMSKVLSRCDDLFHDGRYKDMYDILSRYKDEGNVEVLWRMSRGLYYLSRQAKCETEHKRLICEGFDILKRALMLGDNIAAVHKWYSVFLDARVSYDGLKARIDKLTTVKNHMLRAVALNPKDAITLHMLGNWCFNLSEVPWYQRRIARMVYSEPPESSYEEALKYFLRAEEVNPHFYSHNLLMVGKVYYKLKKMDLARYYLNQACNYPPQSEEDQYTSKEAADMLKNIPVRDFESYTSYVM